MNTRNKWLLRVQSLFLVLTILSSAFIFNAGKANAQEIANASNSAQILNSTPVVVPGKKVQVVYAIKCINEVDGKNVRYVVRKLAFSGEVVTEKAPRLKGYELVSESVQTLTLKAKGNEPIIFKYKKIDMEALNNLKALTKENIDSLKKAPLYEKNDYKAQIDKAFTEKEVNNLFEEIKKIDETTRVQAKYQIKYVDTNDVEIAPSVTKLGFAGDTVNEAAIDIDKYVKPEEATKELTLDIENNEIVFRYEKTDEAKTLKEFISEKAVPNKPLTYTNTNFANRPEELKEFIIKNVYRRNLAIEFYATEKDVDKAYWELWNKTTNASLLRLARNWTAKDSAKEEEISPGVYRYVIGITYNISAEQMSRSEDKVEEIIAKYNLTNKTDFEKVKLIYDYLVKHPVPNTGYKEWNYNVYNYASTLLGNAGVCEGYAMAFNRIAERLGLEAKLVPGILLMYLNPSTRDSYINDAVSEMQTEAFDRKLNHAWNQVKLDGKWYHLDSYHASYYYHNVSQSPTYIYYNFLKSENTMWTERKERIWNNKFTEKSLEDYKGSFTLDDSI